MTQAAVVLEYFKVFLTWPCCVFVLALVFGFCFRKPIAEAIGRIRGIGPKGVRFTGPRVQIAPDKTPPSPEDRKQVLENPLVAEKKAAIEKNVQSGNIHYPEDKEKSLIEALALAELSLQFETVYGLIYGSQIAILEKLNTAWQGVPKDAPKKTYDFAAKTYPAIYGDYPYERYLTFLIDSGLVEEKDELLSITPFGHGFLQFLILAKKPKWKAG